MPGIASASAAAKVVSACQYPPFGKRRYGASRARASDYGRSMEQYVEASMGETLIAVMIETPEASRQAREIADVPGIDAVVVGPFDLSGDLGRFGAFDAAVSQDCLTEIERSVLEAGKIVSTAPRPGHDVDRLLERGHRFLLVGSEVGLLRDALRAQVRLLRPRFLAQAPAC